ncbi:MAG: AMP-binding protein, partial [Anaerolineae bacterium]|nr:AMP-binding protein [Anaerolineae bacterium]
YNGAEPVRWTTIQNFADTFESYGLRRTALYPVYGLAEATLMVSGGVLAEPVVSLGVNAAALAEHRIEVETGPDAQVLVGCGRGMLETRIVIAQPETLTHCAPNEVGEIWLGGPTVTQGYWQHPEITAATFGARLAGSGDGPFFRTGDLGFLRDGELFVTGRLKDLIIIRGRNHYPQDIELTVERSHSVLRQNSGAAFAVDVAGEERLAIVQEIERTAVRDLDVEAVAAAIREAVAEEHELQVYAVHFVRPGSVPKTSSGKIQRQASRAAFVDGSLKTVGEWVLPLPEAVVDRPQAAALGDDDTPSVEAIQAWLANQIAMRLGLDPAEIDIREEFTSYGLDSMELISVSGFLEQWLGRTLSPNVMYDYTTIADLAAHLAEGEAVSG